MTYDIDIDDQYRNPNINKRDHPDLVTSLKCAVGRGARQVSLVEGRLVVW